MVISNVQLAGKLVLNKIFATKAIFIVHFSEKVTSNILLVTFERVIRNCN